jgi:hypothetical protein
MLHILVLVESSRVESSRVEWSGVESSRVERPVGKWRMTFTVRVASRAGGFGAGPDVHSRDGRAVFDANRYRGQPHDT